MPLPDINTLSLLSLEPCSSYFFVVMSQRTRELQGGTHDAFKFPQKSRSKGKKERQEEPVFR